MLTKPNTSAVQHVVTALVALHGDKPAGAGRACRAEDREFLAMSVAFSRTGGLLCGTEVVHRMRRHHGQALSLLARWIVCRSIVSFEWQGQILVPMFQFDAGDMTVRGAAAETLRELVDVFDDWEAAYWFVRPHAWLDNAAPVDVIDRDPVAVVHAARVDRFVARA